MYRTIPLHEIFDPVAPKPAPAAVAVPPRRILAGALPEIRLARAQNALGDLERVLSTSNLAAVRVRYTSLELVCVCRRNER